MQKPTEGDLEYLGAEAERAPVSSFVVTWITLSSFLFLLPSPFHFSPLSLFYPLHSLSSERYFSLELLCSFRSNIKIMRRVFRGKSDTPVVPFLRKEGEGRGGGGELHSTGIKV